MARLKFALIFLNVTLSMVAMFGISSAMPTEPPGGPSRDHFMGAFPHGVRIMYGYMRVAWW